MVCCVLDESIAVQQPAKSIDSMLKCFGDVFVCVFRISIAILLLFFFAVVIIIIIVSVIYS